MTTNILFDHFDQLITRAEDIPRLNELILQLAVAGELAPQNPADEPAAELLKRIKAEKARRIQAGELKKEKPLPPIKADEIPFALPPGWVWVRLGEICSQITDGVHRTPKYVSDGIPFISVNNFINNKISFERTKFITQAEHEELTKRCNPQKGDILMGKVGSIGVCDVVETDDDFSIFVQIALLKNDKRSVDSYFLRFSILSPLLQTQIRLKSSGTALQYIGLNKISELLIPLPPLAEQQRVVARVEQLLAQTHALQAELAAAEAERAELTRASLHHLTAAPTPAALYEQWQQLAPTFDALLTGPAAVDDLKQAILQLAVQGRLVEQNPADEPASALLKHINAEKARRVKAGELRKSNPLPPVSPEEIPFAVPEGWEWCRFPEVGDLARGQSKHRPRNDPKLYEGGKYPFVQTGEVARSGGRITTYTTMYGETGLAQSRIWPKGTLCITIAANIAETGILEFDACFPDSVVGFVPSEIIGTAEYFQYFMNVVKNQLNESASATAQKNINLGILQSLLIPLPPLAEQQRIVERVEQLLARCDDLKAQLAAGESARAELLAALLHGAANGRPEG